VALGGGAHAEEREGKGKMERKRGREGRKWKAGFRGERAGTPTCANRSSPLFSLLRV